MNFIQKCEEVAKLCDNKIYLFKTKFPTYQNHLVRVYFFLPSCLSFIQQKNILYLHQDHDSDINIPIKHVQAHSKPKIIAIRFKLTQYPSCTQYFGEPTTIAQIEKIARGLGSPAER